MPLNVFLIHGSSTKLTGEKIRHFYPLASRASGAKNLLALMMF